jgi:hypothetical protein
LLDLREDCVIAYRNCALNIALITGFNFYYARMIDILEFQFLGSPSRFGCDSARATGGIDTTTIIAAQAPHLSFVDVYLIW